MSENVVEFGLYLTYILLGVAILAVLVLWVINAIDNPKTLVKTGIGLGVLVVVFAIGWALSTYDHVSVKAAEDGLTASGVKNVGGVLTMMYLLLFGAIVGIVITEISKFFK